MSSRPAFWIYLGGVAILGGVLGGFEERLRSAAGDLLFFAGVVGYLLLLRWAGGYVERRRRLHGGR